MSSHTTIAERIERFGLIIPTALPLRTRWGGRLGAFGVWGLVSLMIVVLSFVALATIGAGAPLYVAFALASMGHFVCTWGSVAGVGRLLAQMDDLERSLEGTPRTIRDILLGRLQAWTSPRSTTLFALCFGVGITASLAGHNVLYSESPFAQAFMESSYFLYLPVFLAACAIGVGHSCIAGALAVASATDAFEIRRTYLPGPMRSLSVAYLVVGSLALVAYVLFLGFLLAAFFAGFRLTLPVNVWAVGVGAAVLSLYLYPQWKIHRLLANNRALLIAEAIRRVEECRRGGSAPSDEECERILRALDYVRAMEEFPTLGFRWKEMLGILIGYILPVIAFLLAQVPLIRRMFE